MDSEVLQVHTGSGDVVHDLTEECRRFVASYDDGLLHVFVPHATAGHRDHRDRRRLRRRPPRGPGRPAAGRRPLAAPARLARARPLARDAGARAAVRHACRSLHGRLALGTWQSICLVDLNVDNPDREVRLSFLRWDQAEARPGDGCPSAPGEMTGRAAARVPGRTAHPSVTEQSQPCHRPVCHSADTPRSQPSAAGGHGLARWSRDDHAPRAALVRRAARARPHPRAQRQPDLGGHRHDRDRGRRGSWSCSPTTRTVPDWPRWSRPRATRSCSATTTRRTRRSSCATPWLRPRRTSR